MRGVCLTGIINVDDNQRSQKPPETAFWLDQEYETLMDSAKLSAVASDPWQVNLQGVLSSFLRKMSDYQFCNLRVGGRVLYSASYLLRRKSDVVIFDSGSTQDFIENAQTSEPAHDDSHLGPGQEQVEPDLGSEAGPELNAGFTELPGNPTQDLGCPNSGGSNPPNLIPLDKIDFHKRGAPTLKGIQRLYYKKIQLQDLAGALSQALNRRNMKPRESRHDTELPALPENFFERAQEERANGERLQKQVEDTIYQMFEERQHPVAFVEVIVHPDRKGIVRTLMSILHLCNKKRIEIWQATGESDTEPEDQSGINIHLAPYGKFRDPHEDNGSQPF